MGILKDKTFIVLIGAFFIMAILVVIGLYYYPGGAPTESVPSPGAPPDNLNLTVEERKVLDIALSDETIKKELSGRKYEIRTINTQNTSASDLSSQFEGPFVQFVRLNDDGSIDDNLVAYVDVRNNRVSSVLPEKPAPMLIPGPVPAAAAPLDPGRFVALKLEVRDTGTLVSGQYPYPGMAQPPVTFFDFPEQHNSSAYPPDYPPKNNSLKILVGVINIEDSPVHLTTHLDTVIGVYGLPYTLEPGLTITGVGENGTVEVSYNGGLIDSASFKMAYGKESISLEPGTAWTSPVISRRSETNTIKYPPPNAITGEDGGTNYTYTISYARAWTIENKGVFGK